MKSNAKLLIESDLKRYNIKRQFGLRLFFRYMFFDAAPGVKFSIIFRLCQYYRRKNRLLFFFFYVWLRRLKFAYGFDISYRTQIGKGLYIGHFGGIVIHGDTIIGDNCNLSQGITIGVLNRGSNSGIPVIGNKVFIGPGAVILGGITIGNEVLIGANAVVHFNVPNQAVVAAPAASIISNKGTSGYVTNTV
jgi:serine O-acetyltransferase